MNVYDFINKLEVFNIYHGDINLQHHVIISDIINKNNSYEKNISQSRTGILKCECFYRNELKLLRNFNK